MLSNEEESEENRIAFFSGNLVDTNSKHTRLRLSFALTPLALLARTQ